MESDTYPRRLLSLKDTGRFGAILADPPWRFATWDKKKSIKKRTKASNVLPHYKTMTMAEIAALPIERLAADDCCLFLWASWPMLLDALRLVESWGFKYKTCAFDWMKTLKYGTRPAMGMGYWTRSNTEPCLLATRGKPRRLSAAVRQGIIEPRREHSRKPDCIHDRIERLVAGPYLELFARAERPNWTVWGNETGKFNAERP